MYSVGMIDELCTKKDLKGSSHGLIEILPHEIPGEGTNKRIRSAGTQGAIIDQIGYSGGQGGTK
jgi:hypothetical protein